MIRIPSIVSGPERLIRTPLEYLLGLLREEETVRKAHRCGSAATSFIFFFPPVVIYVRIFNISVCSARDELYVFIVKTVKKRKIKHILLFPCRCRQNLGYCLRFYRILYETIESKTCIT